MKRQSRKGQFRRRLFYALLPVVVLFFATEASLRMSGWPKKDPTREFAHNDVYWVTDASLQKEAFSHKETGGSFRVSTDGNGLRVPLHPEEKTPGTFRILTLGCSTTFGWGVDDEASYPARLEATLQADGHPVEVINGGQPGYSSFQGLWLWEKTLRRYQPDLVVFGYIVQDSRKVAYSDKSQALLQHNADFLKQNFLYNLRVYQLLRNAVDGYRLEAKEAGGEYRVSPEDYVENLRTFQARSTEVGAKMMLFGFPLEREGYTTEHRHILHSASEVMGVPIYDPQPAVEKLTASKVLYFPQDRGHANAEGNEVIASGMARFLVDNKLVP